jgi:hypothetical protein
MKIITSTKWKDAPISTISEILSSTKKAYKYRTLVNIRESVTYNKNEYVVKACPGCLKELKNDEECELCHEKGKSTFCVKFLVKDKTGELYTYLFDKEAVGMKFLNYLRRCSLD